MLFIVMSFAIVFDGHLQQKAFQPAGEEIKTSDCETDPHCFRLSLVGHLFANANDVCFVDFSLALAREWPSVAMGRI